MAIPNPITALVAFLKDDAEVTTQVVAKVFGAELPEGETAPSAGDKDRERYANALRRLLDTA